MEFRPPPHKENHQRLVATMHHGRHIGGLILIGLGVKIDYSLFITRTRTGVRRGLSVDDAVTACCWHFGRALGRLPCASPCPAGILTVGC
jgi:hypothetical protein